MKKTAWAVLCFLLLTGMVCSAEDRAYSEVFEDGTFDYVWFGDLGQCFSVRSFCEAYGRAVDWDGATNTVYIGAKGDFVPTDEIKLAVDGEIIDAPVAALDGRTYMRWADLGNIVDRWTAEAGGDILKGVPDGTVYVCTNYLSDDDVLYMDGETGEYAEPDPARRAAAEKALAAVKEKLGVDLKFKGYGTDIQLLLPGEMLYGRYYCDLAVLWCGIQGNILSENVLQSIEPYSDIFEGDSEWLLQGRTLGERFFLERDLNFVTGWQLCYNAGLLDRVPALKEADGTTLYPGELYERGEWTWSRFEEYLRAIAESGLRPYEVNYGYAALEALASGGGAVFDGERFLADSPQAAEAMAYLRGLAEEGLLTCKTVNRESGSVDGGWLNAVHDFIWGRGNVFTNGAPWRLDNVGAAGITMGIVPFPKPDGYEGSGILRPAQDSVGLVKGLGPERSRLALEAYAMYKNEFYKALGGVNSVVEYIDSQAAAEAARLGIDVSHPEIGGINTAILEEMVRTPINDWSEAMSVFWDWSDAVGRYIFGFEGCEDYIGTVERTVNPKLIYSGD